MLNMPEAQNNKTLYYADDDADDRQLFMEMMHSVNPSTNVKAFEDGLQLYQELVKPGTLLPCCIVLDIKMPLWDGLKTLRVLKQDPLYNHIPVCMLTTSQNVLERRGCEELGAHAFFTKPSSINDLKSIGQYLTQWCQETCACGPESCK